VKKILLDTNAYTALLSGDKRVLQPLAEAETVFFSVFVMGELFAGFRGGGKAEKNRETLRAFLDKPRVKILNATTDTAEVFGRIKHALKSAGTPIPINDVWIASHAQETGSALVSFDEHFNYVPGLLLWDIPS